MLLESDVPLRRLTAQPCRRPSLPRRKWMASHGNRCARLRGRSARRAPRSFAARAARWSSRRCPSSKVLLCASPFSHAPALRLQVLVPLTARGCLLLTPQCATLACPVPPTLCPLAVCCCLPCAFQGGTLQE